MNDNKKIETHRVTVPIPVGMLNWLESHYSPNGIITSSPSKLILMALLDLWNKVNRSEIKPSITEGDE
jgi:hypothetical protein